MGPDSRSAAMVFVWARICTHVPLPKPPSSELSEIDGAPCVAFLGPNIGQGMHVYSHLFKKLSENEKAVSKHRHWDRTGG